MLVKKILNVKVTTQLYIINNCWRNHFVLKIINKNENYKIDNLYNNFLINRTDIFAKCILILINTMIKF